MPSSSPQSLTWGTLDSDEPSIIPGFFAVYKQDRWSGFFAVTVPGGGGKVRYNDGDARTVCCRFWRRQGLWALPGRLPATPQHRPVHRGRQPLCRLQPGRRLQDLRFAVAVRRCALCRCLLRNSKATAERDDRALRNPSTSRSNETDEAWNYFLGLDYAPIKDLNIALTYMSNTPLNFKADTRDNYHCPRRQLHLFAASAGRTAPTSVKICPATSRRVYPTSSSRARSGSSRTSHTTSRNRPNLRGNAFKIPTPATAMTSESRWSTF